VVEAPDPADNTALVYSGGVGYLIKKGTRIGPRRGYVREITPNGVVIAEPGLRLAVLSRRASDELPLPDAVLRKGGSDPSSALAPPAPSGTLPVGGGYTVPGGA
jgi:hypothetical protein